MDNQSKSTKDEKQQASVGIIMGSDSDLPMMQAAADISTFSKSHMSLRLCLRIVHRFVWCNMRKAQNSAA